MDIKAQKRYDPWEFFNLPDGDLKLVQQAYAAKIGNNKEERAQHEMRLLQFILWPAYLQTPANTKTYDLNSAEAFRFAKLAAIASFIAQYYQPSHSGYRIPLLPEKIIHYFRPPYNGIRDYNRDALIAWKKTLPEQYQRMVHINA